MYNEVEKWDKEIEEPPKSLQLEQGISSSSSRGKQAVWRKA